MSQKETLGLGVVETPSEVVEAMVGLLEAPSTPARILEPACGTAPFLRAIRHRFGSRHALWGVDIRPEPLSEARRLLPQAHFIQEDFLLWEPEERFDIILGNPPYGIIGDVSHYAIPHLKSRKETYKKRFHTWRGKYNIYGAFIEKAMQLLAPGGTLLFVVPASWLVLEDFSLLRRFLAENAHLRVFYVGSVFPKRQVSCTYLFARKGGKGLEVYDGLRFSHSVPDYQGELISFTASAPVSEATVALSELFEIHFAARSPEFLRHPAVRRQAEPGLVPVLTGRNLQPGMILYDRNFSGLWMPLKEAPQLRWFYGVPHLVVAHTKGTRVVAAIDDLNYPWREEFHLVPRSPRLPLKAIQSYLNAPAVSTYTQTRYRNFVPHLTLPMLATLPVPLSLTEGIQLSLL